jgi:multisubunit Na+/H+ antiporter MnhG subunit
MRKSTRIAVGAFLGVVFVTLVLTAPISALAQNRSTETTGQQPHKHSHQHTHQGNKSGARGAQPQGQQ